MGKTDLDVIGREHVAEALSIAQDQPIPTGEKYALLYRGCRYRPSDILKRAYQCATGESLNGRIDESSGDTHIQHLQRLGYRVVKNTRDVATNERRVMVYEVKSPEQVQANYSRLFSADRQFFYWNSEKFSSLEVGDAVFVVNLSQRELIYALMDATHIPAQYDQTRGLTQFSDLGADYEASSLRGENFIRLRIRESRKAPEGWRWKSMGNSQITYLTGRDSSEVTARNNLRRVNQLLEVFEDKKTTELLNSVYVTLSHSVPPAPDAQTNTPANVTPATKGVPPASIRRGGDAQTTLPGPHLWYIILTQGGWTKTRADNVLWEQDKQANPKRAENGSIRALREGDYIVQQKMRGGIGGLLKVISAPEPCLRKGVPGHRVRFDIVWKLDDEIDRKTILNYRDSLAEALGDIPGPHGKGDEGEVGVLYGYNDSGKVGRLYEYTWEALATLLAAQSIEAPAAISPLLPRLETPPMSIEDNTPIPVKVTERQPKDWLLHAGRWMARQGFFYSDAEIANLYLCLRTKPFVLLAGVSGTGKTQLVRQFARAIGYGDPERHCAVIPVRPDWADNADLIGYRNLKGHYESQRLLKLLQDAAAHPDDIFFVILDEMNLARVEHYFADFLSILETRERSADGSVQTDPVASDPSLNNGVPVRIPENVMFVGTVNMDETTHPFSRKVLDRANAIEMNNVDLDWPESHIHNEPGLPVDKLSGIYADAFSALYLNSVELNEEDKLALVDMIEQLKAINGILSPAGLHFGYRVRDEVAFYLTLNRRLGDLLSWEEALDFQIMQKILPRIHGSAHAVLKVILQLLEHLTGMQGLTDDLSLSDVEARVRQAERNQPRFPRSTAKLLFMLQRYQEDGFTSFWL